MLQGAETQKDNPRRLICMEQVKSTYMQLLLGLLLLPKMYKADLNILYCHIHVCLFPSQS